MGRRGTGGTCFGLDLDWSREGKGGVGGRSVSNIFDNAPFVLLCEVSLSTSAMPGDKVKIRHLADRTGGITLKSELAICTIGK